MMTIRNLSAGASQVLHADHRGSTDLKQLDALRERMRRDCARHLAEELIREGVVKFDEQLMYEPCFGGQRVYMRADLKVAA